MAGTIQGNQYDLNGVHDFILDADGDTFIRGTTDDTVEVHIGGAQKLDYTAGAFAFQEATIVSTTAGNLTLSPNANLDITVTTLVDIINEHTGDAGVTIEGVKMEDSEISAAGALTLNPVGNVVSKLIDLSSIGAGNPLLKIIGTTDVPTAVWDTAEGYEVTTAPTGWMEALVGATPVYIPYWV